MKKKYILVSMVKNEADIIESFVRYHLCIFDQIIILDNKSTDNTCHILEQLKHEGIPLTIIKDESLEFIKGKKTTKLVYDTLQKHNPDVIFLLDADEFLTSVGSNVHPREYIDQLIQDKVYYINRENYLPHSSDNMSEQFVPKRIIHKSDDTISRKVIFTRKILKNFKINIGQGNHGLLPGNKSVKRETLNNLKIAHFPFRSIEHFKSKVIIGWIANLSRHDRKEKDSLPWKHWFNKVRANPDITFAELFANKQFTRKPINLSFCNEIKMKYSKKNEVCFMKNLLNYCELLALDQADLRNKLLNQKGHER
ncbi:glycosyltransferase family 2 protein [Alkalihalobacterium sp. APHAB7]|uniref:glycosyltransferase family 2 protein n=1 Tax=Alkalihalobacterium sp. APHAB7 TaxID=3402081 RepID=UPI003AB0B502